MQPPPVPAAGSIFLDARGGGRALRVTWHPESDLVVLSLWRDNVCAGSFRLAADEVPALIELLQAAPSAATPDATPEAHPEAPEAHPA
jgi:hypothetical protein